MFEGLEKKKQETDKANRRGVEVINRLIALTLMATKLLFLC